MGRVAGGGRTRGGRAGWSLRTGKRRRAGGKSGEAAAWADRLVAQVRAWRAELAAVAPWIGAVRACDGQADARPQESGTPELGGDPRELLTPTSLAAAAGRTEGLVAELAALERQARARPPMPSGRSYGSSTSKAAEWLDRLRRLADRAETLAATMDFRPLYRPDRNLFAIGFNLAQGKLDNACYDLLASESCLTSYLAVARARRRAATGSSWAGTSFARRAGSG